MGDSKEKELKDLKQELLSYKNDRSALSSQLSSGDISVDEDAYGSIEREIDEIDSKIEKTNKRIEELEKQQISKTGGRKHRRTRKHKKQTKKSRRHRK